MIIYRLYRRARQFLIGDEGLVTLEWVAIAAAVIILGVGVIVILKPSVNSAVNSVGAKIVNSVNSSP